MSTPARAAVCALAALALSAAGCGSSSPQAPDPATVIPSSAPVYISADVRPEGTAKTDAETDAQTLTHKSKPFAQLLQALSLRGSSTPVTAAEVTPWLGERAGVFLTHIVLPALHAPSTLAGMLEYALSGRLLASMTPAVPIAGGAGSGSTLYSQSEGAVVVDTTNAAKARAFLNAQSAGAGTRSATYKGVALAVTQNGRAGALVGSFLVIGSEKALEEVIDTADGAASVVHLSAYTSLRESAAPGALMDVYVKPEGLRAVVAGSGPGAGAASSDSARQLAGALRALAPSGDLYVSVTPQARQVRLDIDSTSGTSAQPPTANGNEQIAAAEQLMQALPEGSWLSASTQDLGTTAAKALTLLSSLRTTPAAAGAAGGGLGHLLGNGTLGSVAPTVLPALERILDALKTNSARLKDQALGELGPSALFVSGTSLPEFDAGFVITPKSPATARMEVADLPSLLAGSGVAVAPTMLPGTEAADSVTVTGLPIPVQVAAAQGKLVVALGLSAIEDTLTPSATLGSSSAYQTAVTALGEGMRPSLLVDFPPLVSLIATIGLGENHTIAKITPYLKSVSTLTVGTKSLGTVTRTRVLLGLP
jgi:hypothetical protein